MSDPPEVLTDLSHKAFQDGFNRPLHSSLAEVSGSLIQKSGSRKFRRIDTDKRATLIPGAPASKPDGGDHEQSQ